VAAKRPSKDDGLGASALQWRSWKPDESQVESCEHQDNANIRHQPSPELVSEEQDIDTDDDGGHRHHIKNNCDLFPHFTTFGYAARPA
jgi:hypothetical protein